MKCKTCGEMNCMAHGGSVYDEDHEKGVHPRSYSRQGGGVSESGNALRDTAGMKKGGPFDKRPMVKAEHHKVLGEMRSLPKPNLKGLAKGGMAEEGQDMDMDQDGDMDNELHEALAHELMEAFEKKDKKGVLESIKALVMSCGGKV